MYDWSKSPSSGLFIGQVLSQVRCFGRSFPINGYDSTVPSGLPYAQNQGHYDLILRRQHHFFELPDSTARKRFSLLVTLARSPARQLKQEELLTRLLPGDRYWRSFVTGDESKGFLWLHAFISFLKPNISELDPLLLSIADDLTDDVVIAPALFEWPFNPYDGDVDVFLPSSGERDRVSRLHQEWLSIRVRSIAATLALYPVAAGWAQFEWAVFSICLCQVHDVILQPTQKRLQVPVPGSTS